MKRKWPMWRKRQRNYVWTPDLSHRWYENKKNPPIDEGEEDVGIEDE